MTGTLLLWCITWLRPLWCSSLLSVRVTAPLNCRRAGNTNWPFLCWHVLTLEKWVPPSAHAYCMGTEANSAQLIHRRHTNQHRLALLLQWKHTDENHATALRQTQIFTCGEDITNLFFHAACAATERSCEDIGAEKKKDHRWACVDEPQAEFQRSTSNLGHNSHRSSGHEETLLFLSGLINMDGESCVSISWATFWPLSFPHPISVAVGFFVLFFCFFFSPKGTMENEMVDGEPPDIHLFYSSNVARLHAALFQRWYQISLCCAAARLLQI